LEKIILEREIYPNAPLQFVAFEVRMPPAPQLGTLEAATTVYEKLRDLVPIIHGPAQAPIEPSAPRASISFSAGGSQTRMVNRERTLSVMVAPTAVVVETSAYTQFEEFLKVIHRALQAAASAVAPAGIQRVGIRYIDEIRVEAVRSPVDWFDYINPALLCAMRVDADLTPQRTEGLAEFELDDGQRTVMRFGAMSGRVVDPGGPLRLRRAEEGPFFLIDLDSFWASPDEGIPEFDVERVIDTVKRLRGPVRTLFEASITDRLRDEVFRKEVGAG
jgi:uncharacterized protein (TIGR04255 family)